MRKKVCSFCLVLLLSFGLAAPASAQSFSDVPASHWANAAIEDMAARGIVQGIGGGQFHPSGQVSMAEFCTMLTRLFFPQELSAYADPYTYWWEPYAVAALHSGLLSGTQSGSAYENGQWDRTTMERPAARYDMAQIMYNLLQAKGISMPSAEALAASRAEIPDYAAIPVQYRPAVETMYALGCLKGTGTDGSFSGQAQMDRASACEVLVRLLSQAENNAPSSEDSILQEKRMEMLQLINAERTKAGLNTLRLDPQVCDYAQTRAEEITENFSHTRPNGQNYWTALGEAGIPYYPGGENISAGRESAAATMEGWMNSTGHRANILREGIGGVGIGYVQSNSGYGHYWVQIFVP